MFEDLDSSLLETYGEEASGYELPIFYPATGQTRAIDGILTETQAEPSLPGNVSTLFVLSAAFEDEPPERMDVVKIRDVYFSIQDVRERGLGGLELILRKK